MDALHITVDVRSVYGQEKVYPVDEAAKTFARIAGTTTLTKEALGEIFRLGYEIRHVQHDPVLRVRPADVIEYCPRCEAKVRTDDTGAACAECRGPL